jgi:transcriptional regulator CtsR
VAILSDNIEEFIKSLLDEYDEMIEIQRNELANYFSCAPSQINYVLATRFSPEKGYYIESKRGGGGFIKLVKVSADRRTHIQSLYDAYLKGGQISEKKANDLLTNLRSLGYLNEKEEKRIASMISDRAIKIPSNVKDVIRANMLSEMLNTLLGEE